MLYQSALLICAEIMACLRLQSLMLFYFVFFVLIPQTATRRRNPLSKLIHFFI